MCTGFLCYCFRAHKSSKSKPLIVMNATRGHLHIVLAHNLPSVDWTAHTVVLKAAECCSSLSYFPSGFSQLCCKTAYFICWIFKDVSLWPLSCWELVEHLFVSCNRVITDAMQRTGSFVLYIYYVMCMYVYDYIHCSTDCNHFREPC